MNKLGILMQGRLANQLFEIAAAEKIAKDYGYEFVGMFENKQDAKYDFYSAGEYINKTVLRNCKINELTKEQANWKIYPKRVNDYVLNKNFTPVPTDYSGNVLLIDLYQDAKYIDKDIAFNLFKPYDSIKQEIRELYGDLSNVVCINVRRGDYLRLADNYWNEKDLQEIIDLYFKNDKILFVSDDIEWCKENFKGEQFMFADKPCKNKVEMDLYIQTQCRDNVISNSSFSWWGAYLNENENKKVIYPYPWFCKWENKFQQIIPNDDRWIKYEWKYAK